MVSGQLSVVRCSSDTGGVLAGLQGSQFGRRNSGVLSGLARALFGKRSGGRLDHGTKGIEFCLGRRAFEGILTGCISAAYGGSL